MDTGPHEHNAQALSIHLLVGFLKALLQEWVPYLTLGRGCPSALHGSTTTSSSSFANMSRGSV
ncbi:hypothetical protein E2C01_008900 [Portunus trituberculatus]|uniref:Uncharacterized protein n=1 Tax=Portunus trituberculatus TaxID=210409 RepID=A0A5B7D438_PORTR|nr:hypothetical protein [Portunus trituberculatus]